MTNSEFFKSFVDAVNANPIHTLAVKCFEQGMTLDKAIAIMKSPELCDVPEPYRVRFINHISDLRNNLYPKKICKLLKQRKA
jgi:hypothetical protein